jgi:mycothiol synthase
VRSQETAETAQCRFIARLGDALAAHLFRMSAARCSALRPRVLPAAMIPVVAAAANEYDTALRVLFDRLPEPQRHSNITDVMRALARGSITLHGLLVARDGSIIQGAVLYLMQRDRTAFVWPPRVSAGVPETETADGLVQELIKRIEDAGAWIGQALLDPRCQDDGRSLSRNGFTHLTDLRFLARLLDASCLSKSSEGTSQSGLETVVYQPGANDARFARLLERTYIETRDCPELGGRRTGEQAMISHQMSGEFDPSRWWLFRCRGQDAGVLLLNDHPEQQTWEVVYVGVAPEFRGRGLCRSMLEQGFSAARQAGRSGVLLAVDSRNDYASRIYDALGFVETDRRAVYVYFPRRGPDGPNRQ